MQQLTTLDFLCQASDSLLRMHSCDTVSALTILHFFCLPGWREVFIPPSSRAVHCCFLNVLKKDLEFSHEIIIISFMNS